jgi:hypothetical protein
MFVDEPTSGHVDEYRAWFHRGELVGADNPAASSGSRSSDTSVSGAMSISNTRR